MCDVGENADNKFPNALTWTTNTYYRCGNHDLNAYIPGAAVINTFWPKYITYDMGRKAVYSSMKFLSRQRDPTFSAGFPVVFDIWGANEIKAVEEVEDPNGIYPKGSRQANQAYWSSWEYTNGTDAWKNDWVKLATCIILTDAGENVYYENMPLSSEDIAKYKEGYEFEFDLGVTDAFRYLRYEMHKTNGGNSFITISGFKYWGAYKD